MTVPRPLPGDNGAEKKRERKKERKKGRKVVKTTAGMRIANVLRLEG